MCQCIFLFRQHNWCRSFFHLNVLDLNLTLSVTEQSCRNAWKALCVKFYRGSFGLTTQQSTCASLRETHSSGLTLRPEPDSRPHLMPAGRYRCSLPVPLINTLCGHRATLQSACLKATEVKYILSITKKYPLCRMSPSIMFIWLLYHCSEISMYAAYRCSLTR